MVDTVPEQQAEDRPVLNPHSSLVIEAIDDLRHTVELAAAEVRSREREGGTIHHTPFTDHLKLQVTKWMVFPAVVTNFALMVGTNKVARVRASAGAVAVDLPITIEPGTNVKVVDDTTGAVLDGDPATLLDSYLIAFVEESR